MQHTTDYFSQSLQNYATAVDQKLSNLQADLGKVSTSSTTTDYLSQKTPANRDRVNKELQLQSIAGPWEALYVTDLNGKILATTSQKPIELGLPIFALPGGYGERFKILRDKNQIVSDVQNTAENVEFGDISMLRPIVVDGKTIGYTAGTYSLKNFENLLNISSGDNLHIYNSQALRVAQLGDVPVGFMHESIDKIYQNNKSVVEAKSININNNTQLIMLPAFGSGVISQLNWRIVGALNIDRILSDIDGFRREVYIVTFVVLFLVDVFLIFFFNWLIVNPLRYLKIIAQGIAAGDYKEHPLMDGRGDVIGRLQHSVSDMAQTLIHQQFLLEHKVKDQTIQLTNQVKDLSSAKAEILQSKAKDDALLSSIGEGVFAVNHNKEIILFNKAASNITGYSVEEVMGRKYDEILQFKVEKSHTGISTFIDQTLKGKQGVVQVNAFVKNKSGKWFPIADSVSPVVEKNTISGAIIVFRDITKELQIEETKTEFVSLASHQLRTPLTAISWYTELLLKDSHKDLTANQRKYIKEVQLGNERMVSLVNALLNLSRLELGTVAIDPQEISLSEVCESVQSEIKLLIKKRKQTFTVDVPSTVPAIKTDAQLLRIILQNFVTNAVKYTPENGTIEVHAEYINKNTTKYGQKISANTVLVSVEDNGYGIPKAENSKIFTKLYRASNIKTKNTDGTGLGMYMVKLLAEILKSSIWFTSIEGKGSTFYLAIPVDAKLNKAGNKPLEM
ncbi:PAS domain S-box protein [Candidatus Saccharibacteria bacterium]|nr:PAS domain S-box protein [Candidatus Saccharibacteria bacterium]